MTQEIHRELGSHEARLDSMEKDILAMREDMRRIFEKLDHINTTLSEAKGGWRTLMWVGGAGGVVGAALASFASWLHFPGPK